MKLWRGQPDNWVFRPTPRDVARVWMGLGAFFLVLAWVRSVSPTTSDTGVLGPLYRIVFSPYGCTVIGVLLLVAGVLKYRRNR